MDQLEWLERWLAGARGDETSADCRRVRIETIDNPGWLVTIDLAGTDLVSRAQDRTLLVAGEPPNDSNGNIGGPDWVVCQLKRQQFEGAGDPAKLRLILTQFIDWATGAPSSG